MAVILGDVYKETKEKYGLKLLAGEAGLGAAMNWVYIAESYVGGGYLSGGELIITTGVLCRESPEWLFHFIESMIAEHTCGLILNIGRYVWPAHITKEILDLCERNHYPLFTMPWETLLADVTRDYYNRIFSDNQTNEVITSAFLNLVHGRADADAQISLLEEYGYPAQDHYQAIYVRYTLPETDGQQKRTAESHLRMVLSRHLRETSFSGHLCCAEGYALLIQHVKGEISPAKSFSEKDLTATLPTGKSHPITANSAKISEGKKQYFSAAWINILAANLASHFPKAAIFVGSGSTQPSLQNLPKSFFHAKAAASYAASLYSQTGKRWAAFQDLGFYQLLLAVPDQEALRDYADSLLQPVLSFDAAHHSDYTATLREYLRQDGSVQSVASALYCHRNTINKRIRTLKETLGYPLDSPRTRFELTAAFEIQDFLQFFSQ